MLNPMAFIPEDVDLMKQKPGCSCGWFQGAGTGTCECGGLAGDGFHLPKESMA
ncbi:MAG: hypothetical protein GXO69_02245 [Acidobacteria bacterium]|nr:hypothetical protein [Acidobacteriota bacterium]